MPHFRPTYVGAVAAICSSILLGMLGGSPLKPDATLPHGPVNVGFLGANASGEKKASVETSGTNWKPLPQHGAGRSNSLKPKTPDTVGRNEHGVPDPEAAALLMTALFGLGMEGYCSQRAACRVPLRPSGR